MQRVGPKETKIMKENICTHKKKWTENNEFATQMVVYSLLIVGKTYKNGSRFLNFNETERN